jgi:hypothetical protein
MAVNLRVITNFDKGTLIREALDLMIEKYRTDINLIFR